MLTSIGLMSGTSMDGIDVAMIHSDGEDQFERGPSMFFPYHEGLHTAIARALGEAVAIKQRDERPGSTAALEEAITRAHADAVNGFFETQKLAPDTIDVVGFHGQTILHHPHEQLTVQLGNGQALADAVGVKVVFDMRADDVAAGGQGAPLVPVFHRAVTRKLSQQPVAVVNIGGVANVTYIDGDNDMLAFDTGPGNARIDDWVSFHNGEKLDVDGRIAAKGTVNRDVLAEMLSKPYFLKKPPKSLDRNSFLISDVKNLSFEDGARTLAAFTAHSIAKAADHFPKEPALWIICGGGRRNPILMHEMEKAVHATVMRAEEIGLDGDSLEAEAFAYLAIRSLNGAPLTYPGTTGCPKPISGGKLASPKGAHKAAAE